MSRKLSQGLKATAGAVINADITTLRTGAYVEMAAAQRVMAIATTGSIAQTKKLAIQLKQAQDTSGTGAKNLGAEVDIVAPTGGSVLTGIAEAQINDLDLANGYHCVAVAISSDNASGVAGSAVLILGNNRYVP